LKSPTREAKYFQHGMLYCRAMKFSLHKNQRNQIYRGQCYTLKRINRTYKYWMCAERSRGCRGTLSTNLEATQVMRTSQHAAGSRVYPQTFCHQQQLNELRRLAAEELRSSASSSLDTAAYFQTWDQAQHTMYHSQARRYP
ncbi:hypothetical protein T11_3260, partial [Trichinella zimbabwensis]